MSGAFFMMMAAGGGSAEQPIEGQTGVWIKRGGVTLSSGMKMTGAVVSSGQTQFIYSRGVASGCSVLAGGIQRVSSGGVAKECDVLHFQYVLAGGTALGCVAHYRQYVSSGGSALGTVLRDPPSASVYPAADIAAGATASGLVAEQRGTAWVHAADARDFAVLSGGYLQAYPGAVVSGAVVSDGGRILVNSGASALAVTSNAGAIVNVNAGGYIEYA